MGWYGTDFDGTLAMHPDPENPWPHCGRPVPLHLERIRAHLAAGDEVRIVTARVCGDVTGDREDARAHRQRIERWCEDHLGRKLEVICYKDYGMELLYDDRCKQVVANAGLLVEEDAKEG